MHTYDVVGSISRLRGLLVHTTSFWERIIKKFLLYFNINYQCKLLYSLTFAQRIQVEVSNYLCRVEPFIGRINHRHTMYCVRKMPCINLPRMSKQCRLFSEINSIDLLVASVIHRAQRIFVPTLSKVTRTTRYSSIKESF